MSYKRLAKWEGEEEAKPLDEFRRENQEKLDGWEQLDVRTADSVEQLEDLVRTMDLTNDGPIPEVETMAPMELNHFAPEEDDDKPTRG